MPDSASPRILIIRQRRLGEVILLSALLRNLRARWPQAHLAIATERRFCPAVALMPEAARAFALPRGFAGWPSFFFALRRDRFTHVIDLDASAASALVRQVSGAPVRIITPATATPGEPLAARCLRPLEPLGIPVVHRDPQLTVPAEEADRLRRYVGASRRVLLVHPSAPRGARPWPAEHFAHVIDRLQDESSTQVMLVGGAADAGLLAAIRAHVHTHLLALPGSWDIPRLAALAAISDAAFGHVAGPMHLAAAVGRPVVALNAAQQRDTLALGQPPHGVLPTGAQPATIDSVTPESVLSAVRAALQRPRAV